MRWSRVRLPPGSPFPFTTAASTAPRSTALLSARNPGTRFRPSPGSGAAYRGTSDTPPRQPRRSAPSSQKTAQAPAEYCRTRGIDHRILTFRSRLSEGLILYRLPKVEQIVGQMDSRRDGLVTGRQAASACAHTGVASVRRTARPSRGGSEPRVKPRTGADGTAGPRARTLRRPGSAMTARVTPSTSPIMPATASAPALMAMLIAAVSIAAVRWSLHW